MRSFVLNCFVLILYHIFVFVTSTTIQGLQVCRSEPVMSTNRWYWPVLQKYCSVHCSTAVPVPPVLLLCSTTCITSAPWTRKMPSRYPCPKAAEARGQRPAGSRPPQGMGITGPFWRALLSHRRGHNGSYKIKSLTITF